ncbi:hypothetical protein [Patulibacter minatonensis]|uniref:hypothetical protein n=1 Tax=Patulibacter minatonensis TaxID=298163 RepID=UPI0012F99CA8|nr:hypothetical protein [Patulibacter minatonensis]
MLGEGVATQQLSMQEIANLAQVERAAVTMWRSRYPATSARPFPDPISTDPVRFEASAVAAWLSTTGLGNNPEAPLETALHADTFRRVTAAPGAASALLLAHHLLGEPTADLDPDEATQRLGALRPGQAYGPSIVDESVLDEVALSAAFRDHDLRKTVDELAEAAYSGAGALDRLVETFTDRDGPWATEALTDAARELLGGVVAELHRAHPRVVVPEGPGGLLLAGSLVDHLDECERPTLHLQTSTLATDADRAGWRRLAAHEFPIAAPDVASSETGGGKLHLLLRQDVRRPKDLTDDVERLLVELGSDDLLLVVGPAQVLTERDGRHVRSPLLAPAPDYAAPLRYAARLPKGLSRFGGRRRLALWVFGRPESHWTVVGAHGDARLDAAVRSAITADVIVSVSPARDVAAHAFRTSSVRETLRFVRQAALTAPAARVTPAVLGGERVARLWALRDALPDAHPTDPLAGVDLIATEAPSPQTVALADAVPGLAADIAGVRIADEHLGPLAAGAAGVVGPAEIRDPASVGRRGIDRLVLERVAPRARPTEPGDVVYVPTGVPAAFVDEDGGHVVLAPARILRCSEGSGGRRLLPAVVAVDVAAQTGGDRLAWQLRTAPAERADDLTAVLARSAERRRQLVRALRTLDDVERQLVDGVVDGALHVSLTPSVPSQSPTPKAAR